ncbi:MAG: hypothetical protein ABL878_17360, partial [Burkholderiales bacterium]
MTTFVSDYTALLSGASIGGKTGSPVFVTFSFPTSVPDYAVQQYGSTGADTFQEFSETFKGTVRTALKMYDDNSGLIFFEVPSGQGLMQFMIFDLAKFGPVPGASGFANYPSQSPSFRVASDVFIDDYDFILNGRSTRDTNLYLILHEAGHAIGLQHGFDGEIQFAPEVNNTSYSILSKDQGSSLDQTRQFAGHLEIFDIQAVQHLYGRPDAGAVQGDAGDNALTGGDGADYLKGNAGHDNLYGGDGADMLFGGDGNDHLYGRSATAGADGNDTLLGGDGSDYLQGNAGADFLAGEGGSDRIQGGADNDQIYGGAGNDTINGNKGDDVVYGEADNDSLRGGQGNDYLNGGDGNDILNGDLGVDTLIGGAGSDLFQFSGQTSPTDTPDVISDFSDGADHFSLGFMPVAVLSGAAQNSAAPALSLAQQIFSGLAGTAELAAIAVGSDTYIFYSSVGGATIDSAVVL